MSTGRFQDPVQHLDHSHQARPQRSQHCPETTARVQAAAAGAMRSMDRKRLLGTLVHHRMAFCLRAHTISIGRTSAHGMVDVDLSLLGGGHVRRASRLQVRLTFFCRTVLCALFCVFFVPCFFGLLFFFVLLPPSFLPSFSSLSKPKRELQ